MGPEYIARYVLVGVYGWEFTDDGSHQTRGVHGHAGVVQSSPWMI